MIAPGLATRVVTRVVSARPAPAHPAILAGSLDSPLPGAVSPGRGVEINGWVIPTVGNRIDGIVAIVEGGRGEPQPLHVARPDVAKDYPAAAAVNAGFSFWCELPRSPSARVQLASLFATGEMVPLLDLHVAVVDEPAPELSLDMRAVSSPDFVIIGTQRGGTTSLHAYLRSHPDIETPAKKEIHYLTDRFARGAEWYMGQFPSSVRVGALVGEATPYALFHPRAPQRLHDIAPNARIVALLRNPVDRAYSHYLHECARGNETLGFEDAIAAEPERLHGLEEQLASGELPVSDLHKRASYMARGRYVRQLERWLSVFPREQLLILQSEDLYADPAAATQRVTEFLGVPPLGGDVFSTHNATSGPPMRAVTRKKLARAFAEDNAQLAELLGWEPDWR